MALALVCAALTAAQADRALEVLRKAVYADGSVAYSGSCDITMYRGCKSTGRWTQHVIRGTGNRQRVAVVAPPEHAGRLIVSDGTTQWEYMPRFRLVTERRLPPLEEMRRNKLETLDRVRETLFARHEGMATIAGRKCHVVRVSPPDGRTLRKRMWVDMEKLVELKWERYAPNGDRVVTWAMTHVDFTPTIAADTFRFTVPPGVKVHRLPLIPRSDIPEAERKAGFRAVVPDYLPPGYVFQRDWVGVGHTPGGPCLWMHFTDGVDAFTITQSRPPKHKGPPGGPAMHWEAQGFWFVLVGPIPQKEKEKIIKSTQN